MECLEVDMQEALMRFEAKEALAQAALVECNLCNLKYDPEDVETLGDRHVCSNCATAHLDTQFDQLGEAYIARSVDRYLASGENKADLDMFYNWWFDGLTRTERVRILKAAYEAEKQTQGTGYRAKDEWEFCVQSDDWQDFVREQLNEETSLQREFIQNKPVA